MTILLRRGLNLFGKYICCILFSNYCFFMFIFDHIVSRGVGGVLLSCITSLPWFSNCHFNLPLTSSFNMWSMYIFLTLGLQILFGVWDIFHPSGCLPTFLWFPVCLFLMMFPLCGNVEGVDLWHILYYFWEVPFF